MNLRPISRFFGLLTLCCCVLSGCDRNAEPQTPVVTPKQVTKSSVSTAAADPLAGMVKAVSADTHQQPIELRFELAGRPETGQAIDIKLNLLAIEDATEVKLAIAADPKLSIIAGGDATFTAIKAGESVSHTVTLRGSNTGIFVLDAKLTVTANGSPRTMNYAIPMAFVPAAEAAAAATKTEHK
jgi:hypothetical protein